LLSDLYQLDYDDFGLALEVMVEWRLDRYYASKLRLLDVSIHAAEKPAKQESKAI
jgi:hypothetical protein